MTARDEGPEVPLGDLAAPARGSRLCGRHGLSASAATLQAELFSKCARALVAGGAPESSLVRAFFVPGRIEVLGKHTDYCGGSSVLSATERGFALVALDATDSAIRIVDARSEERVAFELSPDLEPAPGRWPNYPMTVARRLARNFPASRLGARMAFASNLPAAAGMSSSSAFITGTFLVLASVNRLGDCEPYRTHVRDVESLAAYLACVENGADFGPFEGDCGVGTQGGSEDHTAILCSKPGTISVYSFQPLRFVRRVALPPRFIFAIGSSGLAAEKTGAARELYNRASRLARAVVDVWRRRTGRDDPHLAAILASYPDAIRRLRVFLRSAGGGEFCPAELLERFEHFEGESRIIGEAVRHLEGEDLDAFGACVDRSQELGARLLGNQVDETLFLAREARRLGAVAASAFGAGFGGSVWALVREEEGEAFLEAWRAGYRRSFSARADGADFFTTGASTGAFALTQAS